MQGQEPQNNSSDTLCGQKKSVAAVLLSTHMIVVLYTIIFFSVMPPLVRYI